MANLKKHWNNFYKKKHINRETSFARFVYNTIKRKKGNLLDIGCGNGRDTFYFINKNINALGIDFSKTIIKKNQFYAKNNFMCRNFCTSKLNINSKFDYIYARFFLHAINKKSEMQFFTNIKKVKKKNTIIFLEFRTTNDPMMKKGKKISKFERIYGHYRRFINTDEFRKNIKKNKIKILHFRESNKFAKYAGERPFISRAILSYKK